MAMVGSFENRVMEGKQIGELHVGMGATRMMYTDREAYTVQKVLSDKRVIVTKDETKRLDNNGASDCQKYEYTPVPLYESEPELMCCHPLAYIVDSNNYDCEHPCQGCEFYKKNKLTNGIELRKCKHGWKQVGTDSYFLLGKKEEYYDYSF